MEGERKMVTLRSSDQDEFEVEEAVAMMSKTIGNSMDGPGVDNVIPVFNVNTKILSKVIAYCNKHAQPGAEGGAANGPRRVPPVGSLPGIDELGSSAMPPATAEDDLKNWDAEFVKVDQATLVDLIKAANYLNIQGLLDLTYQAVADMLNAKTPEEIRKTFHIENDFTAQEEEDIHRKNEWAFK